MNIDITTRDGYDIATALRGPDFCTPFSRWLKTLFTARIRAWAGLISYAGNAICEVREHARFDAVIDQGLFQGQTEQAYDALHHFLGHVHTACCVFAMRGGPYQREAGKVLAVADRLLGATLFYQRQFTPKLYAPSQDWGAEEHYWELVWKAIADLNDFANQQEVENDDVPF